MLICLPAAAQQEAPVFEISGTYSYLYASETKSNFNGASASFALNLHPWLGLVADLGGYHQSVGVGASSTNIVTYLFGPRLFYREDLRVTPYAQVLFGGAYDTRRDASTLAMSAGGGFDVRVTPHVALRVAQAEYLLTRFGTGTQNNLRVSAGIVFRFGNK
jgi:hypothetical protein